MIKPIYLDYNGTTPHDPEVIEAMRPFLETEFGNPSSSHWYGIAPKRAVENARKQVAKLINCEPKDVFFTSGGTESNNHAILGVARARGDKGNHIITSAFEHPAVLEVGTAVIPHPTKEGQEALKAWVVFHTGESATEEELIEHCEQFLAPYEVPRRYAFVEELPKTEVGKLLRRELAKMEIEEQGKG